MREVLLILLCYLIGSIPFSYIVSRYMGGMDIRSKGSGNVGATNVLRNLGLKLGLLAFALDLLKGVAAAWIGMVCGGSLIEFFCPLAAMLGHCYPLFLKFRGGKAVATTTGVVLYTNPLICIILVLVFLGVVFISRYVSLGSLVAAGLLPIMGILLDPDISVVLLYFFAALLVIFKHKENIQRLRQGSESKISARMIR